MYHTVLSCTFVTLKLGNWLPISTFKARYGIGMTRIHGGYNVHYPSYLFLPEFVCPHVVLCELHKLTYVNISVHMYWYGTYNFVGISATLYGFTYTGGDLH
jgi:hypothetical protein